MKVRRSINWVSGEAGIEGRANPWAQPNDPDFIIESEVAEERGTPTAFFLLRRGDQYIYRWQVNWEASESYEEYRYTLRGAMRTAEQFLWDDECAKYEAEHPWRALFNRLLWIEDLSAKGFKLWLRNEYGPSKDEIGKSDARIELLERLVEGEVLRRHRESNAAEPSG